MAVLSKTQVLSKLRQSDQAFDLLKNEIIACRLAPGARFSEAELSMRYALAHAATRAALARLTEVKLVQPIARHGFVITPITLASVRELFELRLMIEPPATALAVNRVDVTRLRALNRAPQDAATQTEQLDFVDSNRAFHNEIAMATGNSRVAQILDSLADEMQRLVHFGLFGDGGTDLDRRDADRQHEALITAFEAKDAAAIELAARVHIEHARKLVLNQLMRSFDELPIRASY